MYCKGKERKRVRFTQTATYMQYVHISSCVWNVLPHFISLFFLFIHSFCCRHFCTLCFPENALDNVRASNISRHQLKSNRKMLNQMMMTVAAETNFWRFIDILSIFYALILFGAKWTMHFDGLNFELSSIPIHRLLHTHARRHIGISNRVNIFMRWNGLKPIEL